MAIGREGVDGPPDGGERMDRRRCCVRGIGVGMADAETCREEEPMGGLDNGEGYTGDAEPQQYSPFTGG